MNTDNHSPAMAVHHMVRAIILGAIAFYIIYLHNGDRLTLYIAPKMTLYVKLAALALYAVAAVQFYQAIRSLNKPKAPACDCGHDHAPPSTLRKSILVYSLFVIPLAIFFATPDKTIGSAMAANKGMNLSTSSAIKKTNGAELAPKSSQPPESAPPQDGEVAVPDFPSDEFTAAYAKNAVNLYKKPLIEVKEKSYMETLTTLDLYLDQFVGKEVSIGGFVYREEGMQTNQFIIGRFAIQCCTADALPYGVIAEYGRASDYKADSWLKLTGTLDKTEYKGNVIMKLKVKKVEKIEAASDPYIYPDLDFGL